MTEEKIDEDVVIVGNKGDEVYQRSFVVASKTNGSVTLKSRGKNILKAIDLSQWIYRRFDWVVDNVALQYVEHDGNHDGHPKTVNEVRIIMKKRAAFMIAFVPIALLLKGVHPALMPISLSGLFTCLMDTVILW